MPGFQVNRILEKAAVDLRRQLEVVAGTKPPEPFRVAGQPRLWKRDEPGATRRGFVHGLHAALDGLVSMQEHRGVLDDGDAMRSRFLGFRHEETLSGRGKISGA